MNLGLKVVEGFALLSPSRVRRDVLDAAKPARQIGHLRRPVPVALRLGLAPRLRVLCHPAVPSPHQVLYKVCAASGFRITGDPDAPHDVAFHTMKTRGECGLPASTPVVNRACIDVSKRCVARAFAEAFGRELAVDPAAHHGPIVEKSDENHAHDGRVLDGPLDPGEVRADRVYQRLVDATDGEEVVDLRTPIYGGRIPVVIEKRRPVPRRFDNFQRNLRLHEPADVFTDDERERLLRFAALIGLEFGELDVLRDRDGRLYVVDANNRPAGPAKELEPAHKRRAFDRMVEHFGWMVGDAMARAHAAA